MEKKNNKKKKTREYLREAAKLTLEKETPTQQIQGWKQPLSKPSQEVSTRVPQSEHMRECNRPLSRKQAMNFVNQSTKNMSRVNRGGRDRTKSLKRVSLADNVTEACSLNTIKDPQQKSSFFCGSCSIL